MPLADYPELQKLSRRAKNQLAEELWHAANVDAPVSATQRRVLDARLAAYKAGKSKPISLEELDGRLDRR